MHPNNLAKSAMDKTSWRSFATSWRSFATSWHLFAFARDFSHRVTYTNVDPHILWKHPPPPRHLGSGRRPEKVHCTELLHSLNMIVDHHKKDNPLMKHRLAPPQRSGRPPVPLGCNSRCCVQAAVCYFGWGCRASREIGGFGCPQIRIVLLLLNGEGLKINT